MTTTPRASTSHDAAKVSLFERAQFEAYRLLYGAYPPIRDQPRLGRQGAGRNGCGERLHGP
ncbi:MAG: hypothetical protein ACREQQ_18175, partial [Candidatus Binatia bacterium]